MADDVATARLAERGLTPEQIAARRKQQALPASKVTVVIPNDGDLAQFRHRITEAFQHVSSRSA